MIRCVGILVLVLVLPATAGAQSSPPAPEPRTATNGPALRFDFPGLSVGVAEYDEGPTGATVFRFEEPVMAAVDTRGGSPGTVLTDALRNAYETPFIHAISFAGGSDYGLAAAAGAAEAIKEETPDAGAWDQIAVVPGAIIFDLGWRRYSTVTPDHALGRAALKAARPGWFPLGARGAGRSAMQGWYLDDPQHSGQGGAFRQVGPTKVAVFAVVNSNGAVVDRAGHVVRCGGRLPSCGRIGERLAARLDSLGAREETAGGEHTPALTRNTTLTLVATNQKMSFAQLQRLAVQVHTSMGRAIQPFATVDDGDVLFAVTTSEVENADLSWTDLGAVASETAWDAVLASVPTLPPSGDTIPVRLPSEALDAFTGSYEFAPGARALVAREGDRLLIRSPDRASLYLPRGETTELLSVGTAHFLLRTDRRDRIRFERGPDGAVAGLTINPGPWPIRARRVP